jgi:hypothetical protein
MLHAHLLSPFNFAQDMSKPPYTTLAGVLDLPLLRLQDKLRHIHHLGGGVDGLEWAAKYPGRPADLMMDVTGHGKHFPRKMVIHNNYMPAAFLKNFKKCIPFSLNLVETAKRQIIFARKITSIYPHDPVYKSLLVDSQQRYAKFMNLIRINAT